MLKWLNEYAVRAYTTPDSAVSYLNHTQIAQTTTSVALWRTTVAAESRENGTRLPVQTGSGLIAEINIKVVLSIKFAGSPDVSTILGRGLRSAIASIAITYIDRWGRCLRCRSDVRSHRLVDVVVHVTLRHCPEYESCPLLYCSPLLYSVRSLLSETKSTSTSTSTR